MDWIDSYLDTAELISTQATVALTSNAFRTHIWLINLETWTVPVKTAITISTVERYHEALRQTYRIVNAEASRRNNKNYPKAATKAANKGVGPDGLIQDAFCI